MNRDQIIQFADKDPRFAKAVDMMEQRLAQQPIVPEDMDELISFWNKSSKTRLNMQKSATLPSKTAKLMRECSHLDLTWSLLFPCLWRFMAFRIA